VRAEPVSLAHRAVGQEAVVERAEPPNREQEPLTPQTACMRRRRRGLQIQCGRIHARDLSCRCSIPTGHQEGGKSNVAESTLQYPYGAPGGCKSNVAESTLQYPYGAPGGWQGMEVRGALQGGGGCALRSTCRWLVAA